MALAVFSSVGLCFLLYDNPAPDSYVPAAPLTASPPPQESSVSMAQLNAEARERLFEEMLRDISRAARDDFFTAEERLANIARLLDEMLREMERLR